MTRAYVDTLLRAPVRLHGIELGRPVDVILDRELRRAFGIEVHCGDHGRRFLPFAVARVDGDEIAISSSLVLLDSSELRFYSDRGATFASVRGATVLRGGRGIGQLTDLGLGPDGAIEEIVVETGSGRTSLPYDDSVSFAVPAPRVRAVS